MTDQDNAREAYLAQQAQRRKPLLYPMTEEEKRAYDYSDYEDVRSECRTEDDDEKE